MNTAEIKAFAIAKYKELRDSGTLDEDNWVSFPGDDWDLNIYLNEWEDRIVRVAVYPVIDKIVGTHNDVYHFSFPRGV